MSINHRVFGAPISPGVKDKLKARQSAKGEVKFGDNVTISKDNEFSSRTPFVRMWTAVKIIEPGILAESLPTIEEFGQGGQKEGYPEDVSKGEFIVSEDGYSVHAAQNYATQVQQTQRQQAEAKKQQEYREGQRSASVYFAKKYNLGVDDISNLERFNTPQDMETEAKRMKEFRDTKAELNALKKAQVPSQQFDTNQPAASASGSEEELLDSYNAGVRTPQTEAAARRAAGFG